MSTGIAEWNQIQNRSKERAQVNEDRKALKLPPRGCVESKKLYTKMLKENDARFEDACFLLERDERITHLALANAAKAAGRSVEDFISEASANVKVTEDEKKEIDERAVKVGENPDQLKIGAKDKNGTIDKKGKVKDDGSTAEPASEVTTTKKAS